MTRNRNWILTVATMLTGIACILIAAMMLTQPAYAQDSDDPDGQEEAAPPTNDYCLLCHENTDQVWQLPNGETLSIEIDPAILAGSVHGDSSSEGALLCADCHENFRFPHPVTTSQSIREFRLERYTTCRKCHEDQYTRSQDSVHGAALRNGQEEAATCVDCHGGHDIQHPDEPRERISLTCGRCHGVIFEEYTTSIHGSALIGESNPDVPTCIDCHGVHDIANPTTALFRQRSPDLCAKCHANEELMDQYDISTHVFDSYLTDFHGSTVALFEQEAPGVVTNKAVCYDCHGVHSIQAVSDNEEGVASIRESLVETCRECHPNANEDFPDAWVGHYAPTVDTNAGVFVAGTLYNLLTPLLIGGAAVVVGSSIFRRNRPTETEPTGEEEE